MAGAFAMLAKRATMKADSRGALGTEPRSSRSALDQTPPLTIERHARSEEEALVADAAF
jgi:hypothetical protein